MNVSSVLPWWISYAVGILLSREENGRKKSVLLYAVLPLAWLNMLYCIHVTSATRFQT